MPLFQSILLPITKKPAKRTNKNEALTVPSFSVHFSISLWPIAMKATSKLGNHFTNCI